MKNLFLLLTATLFLQPVSAQLFHKRYGSSYRLDFPSTVIQLSDGNFLIPGYSSTGGMITFLMKVNASGTVLWSKNYGVAGDVIYDVVELDDHSLVMCGAKAIGDTSYDAFLMKTDANGNVAWFKTYGGSDRELFNDLDKDGAGGFYTIGTSGPAIPIVPTIVSRFDSQGNLIWSKQGPKSFFSHAIRTLDDGGVAAVVSYDEHLFMWKLDPSGAEIWSKDYVADPIAAVREYYTIMENPAGDLFVATGWCTLHSDLYLFKLSGAGEQIFAKRYGTAGIETFGAATLASDGSVIICGSASISTALGTPTDDFIAKIGNDGTPFWAKTYPAPEGQQAIAIAPAADHGFILAGFTGIQISTPEEAAGDSAKINLMKTDASGSFGCSDSILNLEVTDYTLNITQGEAITDFALLSNGTSPLYMIDAHFNVINLCLSASLDPVAQYFSGLYPNPFETETTVYLTKPLQDATLFIYNQLGQEVKQQTHLAGTEVTISRNDLPCGMYFLRLVQDGETVVSEKVVIGSFE